MAIASWTALAASFAALFTAMFSVVKWRDEAHARDAGFAEQHKQWSRNFEEQRDQWGRAFEDQRKRGVGEWQITFLRELVIRRLGVYPSLLKTLSAVRYYSDGSAKGLVEFVPAELPNTEADLLNHLYGEAGLVMSARTREKVHGAWFACRTYQQRPHDDALNQLINSFYEARHCLRADIQIGDTQSFQTQIDDMSRELTTSGNAAGHPGVPAVRGQRAGRS